MKLARTSLIAVGLATAALSGCKTVKPEHPVAAAAPQVQYSQGRCQDQSLTLYFEPSSDALTDAGRQLVAVTSRHLKRCTVKELRLVGLADPAGSPAANLELSQRRANTVLDAFVHAGTPVPKYTLVARGDEGAIEPSGAVEPIRRRVDVTLVVGK
jgi:outer membrane protein OmpA-like peptidoglycan-associated protein